MKYLLSRYEGYRIPRPQIAGVYAYPEKLKERLDALGIEISGEIEISNENLDIFNQSISKEGELGIKLNLIEGKSFNPNLKENFSKTIPLIDNEKGFAKLDEILLYRSFYTDVKFFASEDLTQFYVIGDLDNLDDIQFPTGKTGYDIFSSQVGFMNNLPIDTFSPKKNLKSTSLTDDLNKYVQPMIIISNKDFN